MPQPVGQRADASSVDPMSQIPNTMFLLYGYESLPQCKSLFVPSRFMLSSVFESVRSSMPEVLIVQTLATKLGHEANYPKEWRHKVIAGKHKGKLLYDLGQKTDRPLACKWRFEQTAAHPNFKQVQQTASKAAELLFNHASRFERCCVNLLHLTGEERPSQQDLRDQAKLTEALFKKMFTGCVDALFQVLATCPKKARQNQTYFLQFLTALLVDEPSLERSYLKALALDCGFFFPNNHGRWRFLRMANSMLQYFAQLFDESEWRLDSPLFDHHLDPAYFRYPVKGKLVPRD